MTKMPTKGCYIPAAGGINTGNKVKAGVETGRAAGTAAQDVMKRNRAEHFMVASAEAPAYQYGALCWRMHRGHVQVLLITSRDTGRWVIPKGWPIDGKTPAQSAAQEAWEEAGVTGDTEAAVLGLYGYDKTRAPLATLPCMVSVFALRVTRITNKFPERKQRRRKWFDAVKAARKVMEPELRAILSQLVLADDRLMIATPVKDV